MSNSRPLSVLAVRCRMMHALALAPALLMLLGCSPSEAERACRERGTRDVRVLSGSRVSGVHVNPGAVARCDGEAAAVYVAVGDAKAALSPALQRPLDVHLAPHISDGPRLEGPEVHLPTASLLLPEGGLDDLDATVLTHELIHVASAGPRPEGPIAARLIGTIEEAVADYGAAATLGRTNLGPVEGGGARDLAVPAPITEADFHALAIGAAGLDPHRLGQPLAVSFVRREARAGPLLEDLVTALHDPERWPAAPGTGPAVAALLERCPERSRATLRQSLRDWLPAALRPRP